MLNNIETLRILSSWLFWVSISLIFLGGFLQAGRHYLDKRIAFLAEQTIIEQKRVAPKIDAGLAQAKNGDVYVVLVSENLVPIEMRWSVTTEANKVVGGFLLESVKFYPSKDKKQFQHKFTFNENEVSNCYIKFSLEYWSVYSAELGNPPGLRGKIVQEYDYTQGKLEDKFVKANLKETVDKIKKTVEEKQQGEGSIAILQGNLSAGEVNVTKFVAVPATSSEASNAQVEAKIIFFLADFEIKDAKNISAITDNGLGDVLIAFSEDLPTKDYLVNISGDRTFDYEIVAQEKGYIRIKFNEENLKRMQIECRKI